MRLGTGAAIPDPFLEFPEFFFPLGIPVGQNFPLAICYLKRVVRFSHNDPLRIISLTKSLCERKGRKQLYSDSSDCCHNGMGKTKKTLPVWVMLSLPVYALKNSLLVLST